MTFDEWGATVSDPQQTREPTHCLWCGGEMYDETSNYAPYCQRACAESRAKQESDENETKPRRYLSRQEQLEGLADRGIDTWEEYRGEK